MCRGIYLSYLDIVHVQYCIYTIVREVSLGGRYDTISVRRVTTTHMLEKSVNFCVTALSNIFSKIKNGSAKFYSCFIVLFLSIRYKIHRHKASTIMLPPRSHIESQSSSVSVSYCDILRIINSTSPNLCW